MQHVYAYECVRMEIGEWRWESEWCSTSEGAYGLPEQTPSDAAAGEAEGGASVVPTFHHLRPLREERDVKRRA